MCIETVVKPQPNAQQQVPEFALRVMEIMNGGALALMISVGHRTGLFDTMRTLGPATSAQIASQARLSERYVREWLGAMTTGRIVEHDHAAATFTLPEEHAAFLTRAAAPNNLATSVQFIAILGAAEDHVVRAFHDGKGVSYDKYGRFHEVMAEESGQTVVAALDEHIVPLVRGLEARLTRGIDVLDVGCGRGRAILHLAAKYPNSRFTGADFGGVAIEWARREAAERGLNNITFRELDAARMDYSGVFDLVTTFDAVHDQARPDIVLRNIRRALKPGGTYLMQEIRAHTCVHDNLDNPMAPFIYTISCMHCMSVSLAGGGMGLGAAWGREQAADMLRDAGFDRFTLNELEHDMMNDWWVIERGA